MLELYPVGSSVDRSEDELATHEKGRTVSTTLISHGIMRGDSEEESEEDQEAGASKPLVEGDYHQHCRG